MQNNVYYIHTLVSESTKQILKIQIVVTCRFSLDKKRPQS